MGRPIAIREERGDAGHASLGNGVGGAVGARVYVGNLSWDVSWQDLKDHMRQVSSSRIPCHRDRLFAMAVRCNVLFFRVNILGVEQPKYYSYLSEPRCVYWCLQPLNRVQAGDVKFVDLFQVPGGRSKGCAVVEYKNPQHAQVAIRDLNDTELRGRVMFVREDREEVRKVFDQAQCISWSEFSHKT